MQKSNSKSICVTLAALVVLGLVSMNAMAFPLTGGNGITNATVVGVTIDSSDKDASANTLNYITIDIIGDTERSVITLVDSEDRFYNMDTALDIGLDHGTPRMIYYAKIPANAEIKRIRIAPPAKMGDPFSIEWTGVPQTNDSMIGMKFYGIQYTKREDDYAFGDYHPWYIYTWNIDFKIVNEGTAKLRFVYDNFGVVDQFGYLYKGYINNQDPFEGLVLMPGESARLTMEINSVSALSRPTYLECIPTGLKMDISAWV